jgi:hypothetical protein
MNSMLVLPWCDFGTDLPRGRSRDIALQIGAEGVMVPKSAAMRENVGAFSPSAA